MFELLPGSYRNSKHVSPISAAQASRIEHLEGCDIWNNCPECGQVMKLVSKRPLWELFTPPMSIYYLESWQRRWIDLKCPLTLRDRAFRAETLRGECAGPSRVADIFFLRFIYIPLSATPFSKRFILTSKSTGSFNSFCLIVHSDSY